MEPSSNRPRELRLGAWLDFVALGGLGVGLTGYVMPWGADGRLRWAFWLTLSATILHVFTSRRRSKETDVPAEERL